MPSNEGRKRSTRNELHNSAWSKGTALEDLIDLINCHHPEPLNLSKYLFLKKFPDITQLVTCYYCTGCISLLNFEGRQSIHCPNCHCRNIESVLKRNGNFFVYIPIKEQLWQLLSSSVFHNLCFIYMFYNIYFSVFISFL